MNDRADILVYRDFYDFPRMFIAAQDSNLFLFDGSFVDELDDYPNAFEVYRLPPLQPDELSGSWAGLTNRATERLGSVPVEFVNFDPTRRKYINSNVFVTLRVA